MYFYHKYNRNILHCKYNRNVYYWCNTKFEKKQMNKKKKIKVIHNLPFRENHTYSFIKYSSYLHLKLFSKNNMHGIFALQILFSHEILIYFTNNSWETQNLTISNIWCQSPLLSLVCSSQWFLRKWLSFFFCL